MNLRINLLILLIISLVISGCNSGKSSFPTGSYAHGDGHVTTFMDDGTFTLEFNDKILFTNGLYSIDGDTITLNDDFCPQIDGIYLWTIQENDLFFELIEDGCSERASNIINNTPFMQFNP